MSTALANALLQAVRDQRFDLTPDALAGGAPVDAFPSIDLAVVDFAAGGPPRWADVLFSREHPLGMAAEWHGTAGAVANVRFVADVQDAQHRSIAWLPGADWSRIEWQASGDPQRPAAADDPRPRFVAPYPASLLKLMVAVGIGLAVDRGRCRWREDALPIVEPMLCDSDNDATTACVALLHRAGAVDLLDAAFAGCGLTTLRLDGTRAGGGWRNADGAGVGRIQMTAWDTARLLWLLDPDAPRAPWRPVGAPPLLQTDSRDALLALLKQQRHDHVLSSGSLRGLPGHVQGLPDAPGFAHKTGFTQTYASDAGIVRGPGGTHYIVALVSSLGQRHAPHPRCATTWKLPALGAAVHRLLARPMAGAGG